MYGINDEVYCVTSVNELEKVRVLDVTAYTRNDGEESILLTVENKNNLISLVDQDRCFLYKEAAKIQLLEELEDYYEKRKSQIMEMVVGE